MKNKTVLFVDDEPYILRSLERGLIDEPYKKIFVSSSKEALEIMEKEDVSVIVTDMKMPDVNGLELLKTVKEKYPYTIKIVLSGYTQLPQIIATINKSGIFKFIMKPWSLEEELIPTIEEAIQVYEYRVENDRLKKELEERNKLYKQILEDSNKKLGVAKKDYNNSKELDIYLIDSIKDNFDLDNVNLKIINNLDMTKDLYLAYYSTLPSEEYIFNMRSFMEKLAYYIKDNNFNDKVEIRIGNIENLNLKGNYKLLIKMLEFIIKTYLINDNTLRFSISHEKNDNIVKLMFLIEVFGDYKIGIDFSLLNKILETINCKVDTVKEDENYYQAILEIEFK